MKTIGYLEVGRSHDSVIDLVDYCKIVKIPVESAIKGEFLNYDIIIVPMAYNQDVLKKVKVQLSYYVKNGGILIVFGMEQDKSSWLSCCNHNAPYVMKSASITFTNNETSLSKEIFRDIPLSQESILFHSWGYAHGSFSASDGCESLLYAGNDNNLLMAVVTPKGSLGKCFITTLDPDHHAIIGYTAGEHLGLQNAHKLFKNIVRWAVTQSDNQHRLAYNFRQTLALLKNKIPRQLIRVFTQS